MTEDFSEEKFRASLARSGAKVEEVEKIVAFVSRNLHANMPTSEIYDLAFKQLNQLRKPAAARYSLRRALLGFGPSGFPFEHYLGEMFQAKGYSVATNQFLAGACVTHEIDLVAWNDKKLLMVEAKFHNELGAKTDLKVVLYVRARFEDLLEGQFDFGGRLRSLDEGWVITNTKFTTNAIKYAECAGLNIVGWNYPPKGNLHDWVEETGLHPITCLSSLSERDKHVLLEQKAVLCKDVSVDRLKEIGLSQEKILPVMEEVKLLCDI
jgi:hypothetical protein